MKQEDKYILIPTSQTISSIIHVLFLKKRRQEKSIYDNRSAIFALCLIILF